MATEILSSLLPPVIGGISSIISSALGRGRGNETPIQGRQREIIDQLLEGIKGQGQFANLFTADDNAFQQGVVDPALSQFRNQITPNIQQGFIAGGQQRGSGLEDALSRAGVDLSQGLNQQRFAFQQGAQNRIAQALSSILGMSPGASQDQPVGQAIGQGISGALNQPEFGDNIKSILNAIFKQEEQPSSPNGFQQAPIATQRRGFEPEQGVPNRPIGGLIDPFSLGVNI